MTTWLILWAASAAIALVVWFVVSAPTDWDDE